MLLQVALNLNKDYAWKKDASGLRNPLIKVNTATEAENLEAWKERCICEVKIAGIHDGECVCMCEEQTPNYFQVVSSLLFTYRQNLPD